MVRRVLGICLIAVSAAAFADVTTAKGYRAHKGKEGAAPVKDCTRINGRFGYYGNPWCTPAEQARWDAWSARNRWVR